MLAGNVHELRRSSVGLAAGLLALIWGTSGLAQADLFTMAQVRNLPGPERPGYLPRLGRGVLFPGVLGLGVIVTTLLTSLGSYGHNAVVIVVFGEAVALAANIGMYFIAFRVLTPKGAPARKLVPGAVAAGAGWTVLQVFGAYLVHHFLRGDSVYGVFATVLGLLARIYQPSDDQRGTGAAAMAALHRPAAAHRSRPGRPGGSGTAEPAT